MLNKGHLIFASIAIAIKLSSAIILTDCKANNCRQVMNIKYSYSYSVDIFNWVVAINCDFSVLNVLHSRYTRKFKTIMKKYAGN